MEGRERLSIVVLVAAHNEEATILATLLAQLAEERQPDRIVVAIDDCNDLTAQVARSVPRVTVFETEQNLARKPGAMNEAWRRFCADADLVVCVDADTTLDRGALRAWEAEFIADLTLGGSSAMLDVRAPGGMSRRNLGLVRMQRSEFAGRTSGAARRGRRTSVLTGGACCLRNEALRQVAEGRILEGTGSGPWAETSVAEDFELTYQLRLREWETKVSGSVCACTEAMTDLRSLWAQRMKWQTGTIDELLGFGVNRLTFFDWCQQLKGLVFVGVQLGWLVRAAAAMATSRFPFRRLYWCLPVILAAKNVLPLAIARREHDDIALSDRLVQQEAFALLQAGWLAASWAEVLARKAFGRVHRDRWRDQADAEGKTRVLGRPHGGSSRRPRVAP